MAKKVKVKDEEIEVSDDVYALYSILSDIAFRLGRIKNG